MFEDQPHGLGIVIDAIGNQELGFYKEKCVEIFSIKFGLAGDRYIGTKKGGKKYGVGISQKGMTWNLKYYLDKGLKQTALSRNRGLKF